MKFMRNTITLVLFMALAGTAVAQQAGKRAQRMQDQSQMQQMNQKRGQMMMRKLNLTDDQREQVRQIHLENAGKMIPIKNQLREKRARIRTLTTGDDVNLDNAQSVVDEITALQAKQMKMRLATHLKVRSLLTEEQRVMFDMMPHNAIMKSRMQQGNRCKQTGGKRHGR